MMLLAQATGTGAAANEPAATPTTAPATGPAGKHRRTEGRYIIGPDGTAAIRRRQKSDGHGRGAAFECAIYSKSQDHIARQCAKRPARRRDSCSTISRRQSTRASFAFLSRLKQGDLRYNIVVRPDDLIVVRPRPSAEYYMGGHVARVGVYSLTGRKITLTQAVIPPACWISWRFRPLPDHPPDRV